MIETLTLCLIAVVGLVTGVWWRVYILVVLTPAACGVSYLVAPSQGYSTYVTVGFAIFGGMLLQIFYFIGSGVRSLLQMRKEKGRAFALNSHFPRSFSENRKAYDNSKGRKRYSR